MKACPICDSRSGCTVGLLKGSRTGRRTPILACLRCGSLWQRPEYREDPRQLQDDLQWHIDRRPNHLAYASQVVQRLREARPDGRNLLDIGCGIGSLMSAGVDAGLACQGIEPNPGAVAYGKKQYSLDIEEGFFAASSFKEEFDFVVADMVLEHVPNPRLFVAEVFKVLAPAGIFMLRVPDMRGGILRVLYSFAFQRAKRSLFWDNDVHINHFSRKGALFLVSQAGGVLHSQLSPGSYLFRRR